jgi:pyruvate ferredoxin oxidoreductase beta subunit
MNSQFVQFGKRLVPKEELLCRGHRACHGCGLALAIRLALKALGKNVVVSVPPSCWSSVISIYPESWWRVNWIHVLFEAGAAVASGVEAGYRILMEKGRMPQSDIHSVVMAGDGGTADIGIQALSGAFERGHDFLYICMDNEAYMNTGVTRSSLTPYGMATPTSPAGRAGIGKTQQKKNMPAIAVAHEIPYVATACPSYPFDLMDKVRKGAEVKGPAYVHVMAVCPTGWRIPTEATIDVGRLAVETGVFPLYEVKNGVYKLSVDRRKLKKVEEYLKVQGRFRHLSSQEIEKIQERVDKEYAKLRAKARLPERSERDEESEETGTNLI